MANLATLYVGINKITVVMLSCPSANVEDEKYLFLSSLVVFVRESLSLVFEEFSFHLGYICFHFIIHQIFIECLLVLSSR